jgi:hypothetical protein
LANNFCALATQNGGHLTLPRFLHLLFWRARALPRGIILPLLCKCYPVPRGQI